MFRRGKRQNDYLATFFCGTNRYIHGKLPHVRAAFLKLPRNAWNWVFQREKILFSISQMTMRFVNYVVYHYYKLFIYFWDVTFRNGCLIFRNLFIYLFCKRQLLLTFPSIPCFCSVGDAKKIPSQLSKMQLYANIVNEFQMLTDFTKSFIIDVWMGSECASSLICRTFSFEYVYLLAGIYLFKVNIRNARTRFEICSSEQKSHCCRSGVFIANFEQISHLVLVFLLLTLNV